MNRIARYLVQTVIGGTLLALAVILSLQLVFEFIEESGEIGRGDYTAVRALAYIVLRMPYRIYETFPIATLIGSLMGLGMLAARNELTAMRAAGVSVLGIARAVLAAGLLLATLAVVTGEWLAPPAERWAQELRSRALSEQVTLGEGTRFWARDGGRFVEVERAASPARLEGVRLYELGEAGRIERIIAAPEALYRQEGWLLPQATVTRFGPAGVTVEAARGLRWESDLQPQVLDVVVVEPETLPSWDLFRYIRYLERNDLESARYRLALWVKLATPLATLAMLLLTVPLVFGSVRSVGAGQRVFIGVLIGLMFFLASRLLARAGLVYGLPPSLSALLPTLVFLAVGLVGTLRTR